MANEILPRYSKNLKNFLLVLLNLMYVFSIVADISNIHIAIENKKADGLIPTPIP